MWDYDMSLQMALRPNGTHISKLLLGGSFLEFILSFHVDSSQSFQQKPIHSVLQYLSCRLMKSRKSYMQRTNTQTLGDRKVEAAVWWTSERCWKLTIKTSQFKLGLKLRRSEHFKHKKETILIRVSHRTDQNEPWNTWKIYKYLQDR